MKIVVFDTETTGLDAKNCQIIELAVEVYNENLKQTDEMDMLIRLLDPNGTLPPKIVELTHITDDMLKENGVSMETAMQRFAELCEGEDVLLIGHNIQFDLNFLLRAMYNHYRPGMKWINKAKYLDTLTVAKDRKAYPHRLQDMIDYYGLSGQNSHRAIDDVHATAQLFVAMGKERNDYDHYINVFGYNPKYGITGDQIRKVTYLKQEYVNEMTAPDQILPLRAKKEVKYV